jgi:hypothetical protein
MGEIENGPFQLSFNTLLKVDFQGSRVADRDLAAQRGGLHPAHPGECLDRGLGGRPGRRAGVGEDVGFGGGFSESGGGRALQ